LYSDANAMKKRTAMMYKGAVYAMNSTSRGCEMPKC
jgi:hypothetical protein